MVFVNVVTYIVHDFYFKQLKIGRVQFIDLKVPDILIYSYTHIPIEPYLVLSYLIHLYISYKS